jgi:TPR repeat protein
MHAARRLWLSVGSAAALLFSACQSPSAAGLSAYERGEFDVAVARWQPAAAAGDADAQYLLGLAYDLGQGVPRDALAAAKWYGSAAAQDHAPAQNNLALLYARGDGVTQSPQLAAFWFGRAADGGYRPAADNLAYVQPHGEAMRSYAMACATAASDPASATVWLERAAALGHPEAQFLQGWRLFHGQGVSRDATAAAELFAKAADRGVAAAQTHYALCLLRGDGVQADPVAAAEWLRRAAGQGSAPAHFNLALLQVRGQGTEQDRVDALARFTVAAAAGVPEAGRHAAELGAQLSGEQLADARRRAGAMHVTAAAATPAR